MYAPKSAELRRISSFFSPNQKRPTPKQEILSPRPFFSRVFSVKFPPRQQVTSRLFSSLNPSSPPFFRAGPLLFFFNASPGHVEDPLANRPSPSPSPTPSPFSPLKREQQSLLVFLAGRNGGIPPRPHAHFSCPVPSFPFPPSLPKTIEEPFQPLLPRTKKQKPDPPRQDLLLSPCPPLPPFSGMDRSDFSQYRFWVIEANGHELPPPS